MFQNKSQCVEVSFARSMEARSSILGFVAGSALAVRLTFCWPSSGDCFCPNSSSAIHVTDPQRYGQPFSGSNAANPTGNWENRACIYALYSSYKTIWDTPGLFSHDILKPRGAIGGCSAIAILRCSYSRHIITTLIILIRRDGKIFII